VLERLLDAFNRRDLDRIMGFFADECVLETPRGPHPYGTRFAGPEAVRDGLAARFTGRSAAVTCSSSATTRSCARTRTGKIVGA
jgi:ketosteroid isomerase-like protein